MAGEFLVGAALGNAAGVAEESCTDGNLADGNSGGAAPGALCNRRGACASDEGVVLIFPPDDCGSASGVLKLVLHDGQSMRSGILPTLKRASQTGHSRITDIDLKGKASKSRGVTSASIFQRGPDLWWSMHYRIPSTKTNRQKRPVSTVTGDPGLIRSQNRHYRVESALPVLAVVVWPPCEYR